MILSNIGVKLEPNMVSPNRLAPNLSSLDTTLCKMKSPAIITSIEMFDSINIIKSQRGSLYGVIISIDPNGKLFGANKVFSIGKAINADGFDIGLSNKPINDIVNEIKSIMSFLSRGNKEYKIRWGINVQNGDQYVNSCVEAIKKSEVKYDAIKLINTKNFDYVKIVREKLGRAKQKIKININDHKCVNLNDADLFYDIDSSKL